MNDIKTNYPFEWEYKALTELKNDLLKIWENDCATWISLTEENRRIISAFPRDGIKFRQLFKFHDNYLELFNTVLNELIYFDPFLTRIFFYVHTLPEDIQIRNMLLVHERIVNSIFMFFHQRDILKGSDLAKSSSFNGKPLESIPLCHFIIGQILDVLFFEYDHCKMIDQVKISGAEDSIEKLREARLFKSEEGVVYDYSPLFKKIQAPDGSVIIDVSDHFDWYKEKASQRLDEIICTFIQKPQPDPRPNVFFGNNVSDCNLIIRSKTKQEIIPFSLLPKYKHLIRKTAKRYKLSATKTDNKKIETQSNDEIQVAMKGLYEGALTWDRNNYAAPAHFENKIRESLSHAFETVSTKALKKERLEDEMFNFKTDEGFQERILKERFESLGGHLDAQISEKEGTGEVLKDTLRAEGMSPEELLISKEDENEREGIIHEFKEALSRNTKMQAIFNKQEALSPAERQAKKRFIDKLMKRNTSKK